MRLRRLRAAATTALMIGLSACGGGGGAPATPAPAPAPTPQVDRSVTGVAVTKLRATPMGWISLHEVLSARPMSGPVRPVRRLAWQRDDGSPVASYAADNGWSLIDVAVHPSGEATAVVASDLQLRLLRFDAAGRMTVASDVVDPLVPVDPLVDLGATVRNDQSLVPIVTRNAARVAPMGEDAALVIRTGRTALVAYRYGIQDGQHQRRWRTLVGPASSYEGRTFVPYASYDTFGQLDNHWHVLADTAPDGTLYVAVSQSPASSNIALLAHNQHFNDALQSTSGALLTRIDADGQRRWTRALEATQLSEAHGLRTDGTTVALVGRVRTQRLDTGWDAYIALYDTSGVQRGYRVHDIDRGDVLLDVVGLGNGRWLAVGAAGYIQNPAGTSISEAPLPLALVLEGDGRLRQRIDLASGQRHNELRSAALWRNGQLLVAGLTNGPATHTADADLSLLRADGREFSLAL